MLIASLLFSLFLGCSKSTSQTEQTQNQKISSFTMLAESCSSGTCTPKQCQEWYSSELSVEVKDIASIQKLCLLMEEKNDALHQQCGIPACFLLPQYDSRSAKEILRSSLPRTSSQKMLRQALFRGFLTEPKNLAVIFDDSHMMDKFDNWIGVLIAEMECSEVSIAEQMNLKCRTKYPILSEILWSLLERSTIDTEQEIQSILHLMVLFDSDVGLGKIQKVLEGIDQRDDKIIKLALQVLYMQYMRDPQSINKALLLSVKKTCLDRNKIEIQRGCMLWNGVRAEGK